MNFKIDDRFESEIKIFNEIDKNVKFIKYAKIFKMKKIIILKKIKQIK
jgi:hypothetical protein